MNSLFLSFQIKAMVSQLQENQRQMNDALTILKAAVEADNPSLVSEYTLKLEPDFREALSILEEKQVFILNKIENNKFK